MTNRDKINKMTNNDMGVTIFTAITGIQKKYLNHNSFEICDRFIGWLSQEAELTADEMFEELGYEKYEHDAYDEFDSNELYYTMQQNETVKKRIEILKEMLCYKCFTIPENSGFEYITEAEDKAIHKKIAELRLAKEIYREGR